MCKTILRGPCLCHRETCQSLWRAVADSLLGAYEQAFKTDPESAFGGIIAFNGELDAVTAQAIVDRQFVEVIIAPRVSARALR